MIGSIRHKGLRDYWTRGQARGVNAGWIRKLRRILSALEAAERPEHMNYPGSHFHPLRGNRDHLRGALLGPADGQLPCHIRLG